MSKRILIIAGPNGAGKTTFAREYLPNEANLPTFINADLIAAGLSPFNPAAAAVRAGRLMLAEIEACVRRGESSAFETTLSGRGYARRIEEWKRLGYRVELIFLSLPQPELAITRVAERVAHGGHGVPDETIRRRFWKGRRNFDLLYKPLADSWLLYDNRDDEPVLLEKLYAMPADHPLRQEEIEAALRRAAAKARQIAAETGTSLVVMRDGKIMKIKVPRHQVKANGK